VSASRPATSNTQRRTGFSPASFRGADRHLCSSTYLTPAQVPGWRIPLSCALRTQFRLRRILGSLLPACGRGRLLGLARSARLRWLGYVGSAGWVCWADLLGRVPVGTLAEHEVPCRSGRQQGHCRCRPLGAPRIPGRVVLVDDGSCPPGQLRELTGSTPSFERQSRCVRSMSGSTGTISAASKRGCPPSYWKSDGKMVGAVGLEPTTR
jgi:hypothetical protein